VDQLALIERWAENFGLDLAHPIEAALATQEAEHVAGLVAAAVSAYRASQEAALSDVVAYRVVGPDGVEVAVFDPADVTAMRRAVRAAAPGSAPPG
jgi:hypothetical protein